MWANQGAQSALDANVRIPDRNFEGDAPLFDLRGVGWESAVDRQSGNGEKIAAAGNHHRSDSIDKVGASGRNRRQPVRAAIGGFRHGHLMKVVQRCVHGSEISPQNRFTALAIRLFNRVLNLLDGLLAGQNAGQCEEAGLHDGVDPPAHLRFAGHLDGINNVELQLLVDDRVLHLPRDFVPDFLGPVRAVQQKSGTRLGDAQHVDSFQEVELMTRYEARLLDKVRRVDRARARTHVGDGDGAGLLRVVDEIALGIQRRVFANDLHRVLVRPNGAVASQPIEDGPCDVVGLFRRLGIPLQAQVSYVIDRCQP